MKDNEIIETWQKIQDILKRTEIVVLQKDAIDDLVRHITNILDLINHLREENEMLQDCIDEQDIEIASLWKRIEDTKTEAYKEFAEKMHEELRMYGTKNKFNKSVFLNVVDKAKKELVGEDNG